jgi:transcriptional regulator with XRE-family HTH domain
MQEMTGHRNFRELEARAAARPGFEERMARLEEQDRAEEAAFRQTLAEIRRARAVTEAELARELGVTQSQVSRIEGQADLYLSTLQRYLDALGGRLELRAVFEGVEVPLRLDDFTGRPDQEPSGSPERVPDPEPDRETVVVEAAP